MTRPGWNQVHGDVFRPAASPLIFSAFIGTGYQIASVVLIVICFAIFGDLYTERGSMLSTSIFVYAATRYGHSHSLWHKIVNYLPCIPKTLFKQDTFSPMFTASP